MSDSLLASYLLQAAGALITTAIFGGFYREYHKAFLREWALSWAALCVTLAGAGIGVVLSWHLPLANPLRIGLSALVGATGYMQVVWLLFGSNELLGHRPYSGRERAFLLGAAAFIGAAIVAIHATDPDGQAVRFMFRAGVRGVIV